jgi:hypothetical protein
MISKEQKIALMNYIKELNIPYGVQRIPQN